ncbi:hypothetical protein WDU94_015252, partial [Cyamophila willieti]
IKLLELFLVTLNEELLVLNKFQNNENYYQDKIDEIINQIKLKQDKIVKLNLEMQDNDTNIQSLKEKVKTVENKFEELINTLPCNAPVEYFKKLFEARPKTIILQSTVPPVDQEEIAPKPTPVKRKKNWRQQFKECLDYYTTSSEEEEIKNEDNKEKRKEKKYREEEVADIDSYIRDKYDYPLGVDEEVKELVIRLRLIRNKILDEIVILNPKNNGLEKQIQYLNNSILYMRSNMATNNEDLDELIIYKQQKLNLVETTVVLKASQLKNQDDSLDKCIVIASSQFDWLKNRRIELEKETQSQSKKFVGYEKTLSKIKADNLRLQEEYKTKLSQVNEATIKKYGRLVNIPELEEAVLQALIHEVRMDVPNIIKSLDKELKEKQETLEEEKKGLLKLAKGLNQSFSELVDVHQEKSKVEKEIGIIELKKKLEKEKHTHNLSDYEADNAKLSAIYDKFRYEEELILNEIYELTYKGVRPPVKLPPMKKETKPKTKPKQIAMDRGTQLEHANNKIKEILKAMKSHEPNIEAYAAIIDDLKELYGLNIKGADENVDDVIDVMIDLASETEESKIGVSNSEVIHATLSMLLLDIEQTESQLTHKEGVADDGVSIHSEESDTDIIKVSVQPDEGEKVRVSEEQATVNESDGKSESMIKPEDTIDDVPEEQDEVGSVKKTRGPEDTIDDVPEEQDEVGSVHDTILGPEYYT